MAKTREIKTITIPEHDYLRLKHQARHWQLLMAVVRNSERWVGKYGANDQGDFCRGVVEFALPVVLAVKDTLSDPDYHGTATRRAWDLALVHWFREKKRKGE